LVPISQNFHPISQNSVLLTQKKHSISQEHQRLITHSQMHNPAPNFRYEYHPHIQVPLQKAADSEGCSHDTYSTVPEYYKDEIGCACSTLHRRNLVTDNAHYNQELLYEV
jgi:hypothetical protein